MLCNQQTCQFWKSLFLRLINSVPIIAACYVLVEYMVRATYARCSIILAAAAPYLENLWGSWILGVLSCQSCRGYG